MATSPGASVITASFIVEVMTTVVAAGARKCTVLRPYLVGDSCPVYVSGRRRDKGLLLMVCVNVRFQREEEGEGEETVVKTIGG